MQMHKKAGVQPGLIELLNTIQLHEQSNTKVINSGVSNIQGHIPVLIKRGCTKRKEVAYFPIRGRHYESFELEIAVDFEKQLWRVA